MNTIRECVACGAQPCVWEYGVAVAPRTPEGCGWILKQCPKCFATGGIEEELIQMKKKEMEINQQIERLKTERRELRIIIKSTEKGCILVEEV